MDTNKYKDLIIDTNKHKELTMNTNEHKDLIMDTNEHIECEDVGEALREGRALRSASRYRILYAQDNLNFRPVEVDDPMPLGRKILASAGVNPQDDFSLFAILQTGDFEDVRLDEPFDLRERGAERFVSFQTDRDYKLTLDDRQLAWGKPAIKGAELYSLAKVEKDDVVFLKVRGDEDRLIEPNELIDLTLPGIEHFITNPKPATMFEIVVNGCPHAVKDRKVTFEQVVELAFPDYQPNPNVVFSMTYRHADSKPHAGELGAGGVVEVKKGTVFNVTRTDKS